MCYGCWEDEGKPLPKGPARLVGLELRGVDPYGGCHIVREDWNVTDHNIDFCLALPETTDSEKRVLQHLRELPEDQRYAAMAVADELVD